LVAVAGIDGGHVLSAIVNSTANVGKPGDKEAWINLGGLATGDRAEPRPGPRQSRG
jgi:hypothetical protein